MDKPSFGALSAQNQQDALLLAADGSGRQTRQIEKDVWVVGTLSALVNAPFGSYLTFKGGTSLAKAWRAIQRFSEDIDITYDIREFAPDLLENGGSEALPPNISQERR